MPGAEDYINEALAWLGIEIDEGVREGGPFGPYRQSERRDGSCGLEFFGGVECVVCFSCIEEHLHMATVDVA